MTKGCRLAIVALVVAVSAQSVRAGTFLISVVDSLTELSSRTALPGETVFVDVFLENLTGPVLRYGVRFDVNFSREGLGFESYAWASPEFTTGGPDEQTTPGIETLPQTIVAGAPFPTSPEIDIRFDNITDKDPNDLLGFVIPSGVIVSLELSIPGDYAPGVVNIDTDSAFLRPTPFASDTILFGPTFELRVVPEPATLALLGLGGLVGVLRRRRC